MPRGVYQRREQQGAMRLDDTILEAAIEGFEQQKTRIDATIADLRSQLNHKGPGRPAAVSTENTERAATDTGATKKGGKRKLTAEGRANIVAALKKRWAVKKAEAAAATKRQEQTNKNKANALAKARQAKAQKAKSAKKTTKKTAAAGGASGTASA